MGSTLSTNKAATIAITDLLVLVAVYCIPSFVHATSFPLYYFEPMRLLLFAAYLISRNNANAFLLAFTIPLVSTVLPPHHPPFYKAIIISCELAVNLGCFIWLVNKSKWPLFVLFFVSTVASKFFYYSVKYLFIKLALIEGKLISTDLLTQLITLTLLSLLFAIFYRRQKA